MGNLSLVDDGDGLEPPVGMPAHASRSIGWRELRRAGIVQQQKRAERLAMAVI
jgi:hypothetical protein